MKEKISKNITQLILIVFSVVLGIFLSEKIEERKNKKEAALLMAKLKTELNLNKKILNEAFPYHREILVNIDSLVQDDSIIEKFKADETILFEKAFTQGSIMSDFLSADAWDIAKSHPLIVHFDYDELLMLSKIYSQQQMTYESIPKMIQLLLSPDFNNDERAKLNLMGFRNQLWEITGREARLSNHYNEAKKVLGLENN